MNKTLRRGLFALALVAPLGLTAFAPREAHAQMTGGVDSTTYTALDVQNYWPAAGPAQNVALRNSDVQPHLALGFGLLANFMYRPLVFTDVNNPGRTFDAVRLAATTDFVFALGLWERFQIGLAVPIVVAQDGVGASVFGGTNTALPLTTPRDVRFELSWAIVRRERTTNANGFGLRLDLGGAFPTGDKTNYQGARTATFAPMLVADYRVAGLTITANVGARVRELAAVARVAWASQLYAGIGVAYRPTMFNRLAFGVDYQALVALHGDVTMTALNGTSVNYTTLMPMELYFGARYAVDRGRDIEVSLGGGVPLTDSATNPAFRVMAGVSYAPRGTDDDRDGVRDAEDQCPGQAEDRDGFQDEDGCPDPDNDGDNVLDVNDRCPAQPEDADGFEDSDGCPDPDNDGDQVADQDDECATESAGDRPDARHPGCPIRDRDGDQVLDAEDQCPNEPAGPLPDRARRGCPLPDADHDRVADDRDRCPQDPMGSHPDLWRRGCPNPDRDRDGVLNETDRCLEQAETINGVTDEDGCPEEAGPEPAIQWAGPVLAFGNAIRLPAATRALRPQQVALMAQASQHVRSRGAQLRMLHVTVVPAAGVAGQRTAQRLATMVADALINAGVPRDKVVAEVWVAPAPTTPATPAAAPARPARPVVQPVGELRIRAEWNEQEWQVRRGRPGRGPRPNGAGAQQQGGPGPTEDQGQGDEQGEGSGNGAAPAPGAASAGDGAAAPEPAPGAAGNGAAAPSAPSAAGNGAAPSAGEHEHRDAAPPAGTGQR